MNDLDLESYKFKAESLKQFGFVLCIPLSLTVLKLLLREYSLNELIFTIELVFPFIFFIFGFILINRSVELLKQGDKNEYK